MAADLELAPGRQVQTTSLEKWMASRLRRPRSTPLRSTEPVPVSSADAATIADAVPALAGLIVIALVRDGVGLRPCGGSVALL